MYVNRLPTIEDLREYQFAPPEPSTESQRRAASVFIDALDLAADEEQLRPKMTFNPVLQHLYQSIQHRALNPEEPSLPELDENIAAYVKPDQAFFERAEKEVQIFRESFELKNVEKETRRKRVSWRDLVLKEETKETKAKEQAEVEETKEKPGNMFGPEEIKDISVVNPIKDFQKMINERHRDRVSEAIGKMKNIVKRFINESLKESTYENALECLMALRDSCVKEDEPIEFNDFLWELKKKCSRGEHKKVWNMIRKNKITLITKEESINSLIAVSEAEKVTSIAHSVVPRNQCSCRDS
eukprot:TRINITY_DN12568_c0_g2_i1.p2 TRINITY_DN12568_c0_g2~~TRINITY_DN12568_c0_g2_i1.p2  ORF type:complete len:299 (+),score=98.58 TRINITY_DN12568_c0_g2_i1:1496-2392(+)